MRRRDLLAFIAAIAWPGSAWAQRSEKAKLIGVLNGGSPSPPTTQQNIATLKQEVDQLAELKGRKVNFEVRYADNQPDRATLLAKEIVALRPDVIVASSSVSLRALAHETRTIPIVFVSVTDPVGQGLVESLAHPGGNITGFTIAEFSLAGKWLELLKEISPNVTRVALLFSELTRSYTPQYIQSMQTAATAMSIHPVWSRN